MQLAEELDWKGLMITADIVLTIFKRSLSEQDIV
jgi:hypothetical protein